MGEDILIIQQYLKIHPVINMNLGIKRKYMRLLINFVSKIESENQWVNQMFQLYSLTLDVGDVNKDEFDLKDMNIIERFKFRHYRYFILIDCLFIGAFNDNEKEKGMQIFESILDFYGERHRKKLQQIFDAFYSNENEKIVRDFPELASIYRIIWKNRKFIARREKRIMITANMSAGKSTLLNALTGKMVSKTQNMACTSKNHYLHNKAGEDGLTTKWDSSFTLDATTEMLMKDDEENITNEIHIGTRFRSLQDIDNKVCFIDTPGVNSSVEKTHKEVTNEIIKNTECDLLIYLFNAENIGSDDDFEHLNFVKENYSGDIIFLVNKMDRFRKDQDSVLQTIKNVKEDLEKLDFKNPKVYPISAYAAYLAKMSMYNEKLNEDEEDELNFFRRKLSRKEFSYETYYPEKINIDTLTNKYSEVLVHSGVLSLEKLIFGNRGE